MLWVLGCMTLFIDIFQRVSVPIDGFFDFGNSTVVKNGTKEPIPPGLYLPSGIALNEAGMRQFVEHIKSAPHEEGRALILAVLSKNGKNQTGHNHDFDHDNVPTRKPRAKENDNDSENQDTDRLGRSGFGGKDPDPGAAKGKSNGNPDAAPETRHDRGALTAADENYEMGVGAPAGNAEDVKPKARITGHTFSESEQVGDPNNPDGP